MRITYLFKKQRDNMLLQTFSKVIVHQLNKEPNYNNRRPTVIVNRKFNKHIKIQLKAYVNNYLHLITLGVHNLLHYSYRQILTANSIQI